MRWPAAAVCEQGTLSGCYPHEAVTAVCEQGTSNPHLGVAAVASDHSGTSMGYSFGQCRQSFIDRKLSVAIRR